MESKVEESRSKIKNQGSSLQPPQKELNMEKDIPNFLKNTV